MSTGQRETTMPRLKKNHEAMSFRLDAEVPSDSRRTRTNWGRPIYCVLRESSRNNSTIICWTATPIPAQIRILPVVWKSCGKLILPIVKKYPFIASSCMYQMVVRLINHAPVGALTLCGIMVHEIIALVDLLPIRRSWGEERSGVLVSVEVVSRRYMQRQ